MTSLIQWQIARCRTHGRIARLRIGSCGAVWYPRPIVGQAAIDHYVPLAAPLIDSHIRPLHRLTLFPGENMESKVARTGASLGVKLIKRVRTGKKAIFLLIGQEVLQICKNAVCYSPGDKLGMLAHQRGVSLVCPVSCLN